MNSDPAKTDGSFSIVLATLIMAQYKKEASATDEL
jgi:hypothetical protein